MKKHGDNQGKSSKRLPAKPTVVNILDASVQDKTIFIKAGANIFPVEIRHIIYCSSTDPFVSFLFYTANSELIHTARNNDFSMFIALHACNEKPAGYECLVWRKRLTMNEAEAVFATLHFCLVHKSYLVNLLHVKKFVSRKTMASEVIMSNQDVLPVSANGKISLIERIGRF